MSRAAAVWVAATANPGKLREFRSILAPLGIECEGLPAASGVEFPAEGLDYAANALAKARAVARRLGRPALGDDSGLEVAALGGAPGPLSARYGEPGLDDAGRVRHLLQALAAAGASDRSARFVCAVALVDPAGGEWTARGECAGSIRTAASGAGGFGYDPVFEVEGLGMTAAELAPAQKDRVSHRARALRALVERWRGGTSG